jgi:hypothetical protein
MLGKTHTFEALCQHSVNAPDYNVVNIEISAQTEGAVTGRQGHCDKSTQHTVTGLQGNCAQKPLVTGDDH